MVIGESGRETAEEGLDSEQNDAEIVGAAMLAKNERAAQAGQEVGILQDPRNQPARTEAAQASSFLAHIEWQ